MHVRPDVPVATLERPGDADTPAGRTDPPGDVRPGPDPADLGILAFATAMLVLWAPVFYLGLLTPRMAVLFVAAGPGLVVLGGLVRRGDTSARWLAGYLAWALFSVAVSHHPRSALAATYGTDEGWIYLAGYVAAWGLGRRLSPEGRRYLPHVLIGGAVVNACFAILEAAIEPSGELAPIEGRVTGLMSNPLFLAGVLVGGLALLARLCATKPHRRWILLALILPTAMAVNLTGSRAALVGGFSMAVIAATSGTGQGFDARRALRVGGPVAAAVIVGFLLSMPIQQGTSSSQRLGNTSTSSGYTSRGIMWGLGLEAVTERPVAGWGPGRFPEATARRTTAAFVRAEGPDKLFYEAHNLLIEQLVTTGVVGVVLLAGFGWSQIRRCRGPLAWFAVGVALTWAFNPVSVCTGPVALLALGASTRRGPPDEPDPARSPVPARVVGGVLAVLGLLAGGRLLWADALLDSGVADGDLATVERAADLLPGDAVVTNLVAQARSIVADRNPTPANKAAVLAATQRSIDLDSARSHWWFVHGLAENAYGPGPKAENWARSEAAFRSALERSPWSVEAMNGLYGLANLRNDDEARAHWRARLCTVDACPREGPPPGTQPSTTRPSSTTQPSTTTEPPP